MYPPVGILGCPSDLWLVAHNGAGVAVALTGFVSYATGFEFLVALRTDGEPSALALTEPEAEAAPLEAAVVTGSATIRSWECHVRGHSRSNVAADFACWCQFPPDGTHLRLSLGRLVPLSDVQLLVPMEGLRAAGARAITVAKR